MRRVLLSLLLLLALTMPVFAQESDGTQELVDELPSQAQELMDGMSPGEQTDLWGSMKKIFRGALSKSTKSLQEAMKLSTLLLGITLLCGMVDMDGRNELSVRIVGALGICACLLGAVQTAIGLASDTVRDLSTYSAFLLPVMASSLAVSGAPSSATALYAGTVLFSQLLMQLISKLLIPAVFFFLALATAEAALGNDMLSELREFIGWLISKSLRIVLYIFTAYMSLTGVISGSADALAVKATKAAISGMLPVVGGIVSDASETVLAGAALLKNSVGIFGMLAVLGICLIPFLRVGIHYLILKLTACVSAAVGMKPHVALLKHVTSAMGFLLAMCGACALLLLISGVCFLKVVV